jgi:hypothetical protein
MSEPLFEKNVKRNRSNCVSNSPLSTGDRQTKFINTKEFLTNFGYVNQNITFSIYLL